MFKFPLAQLVKRYVNLTLEDTPTISFAAFMFCKFLQKHIFCGTI